MWPTHDLPTPDPKQKRRDFILGIVSREFSLSCVTAVEHLLQVPSAAGVQRPVRPPNGFPGPCTPLDSIKIGDEPRVPSKVPPGPCVTRGRVTPGQALWASIDLRHLGTTEAPLEKLRSFPLFASSFSSCASLSGPTGPWHLGSS